MKANLKMDLPEQAYRDLDVVHTRIIALEQTKYIYKHDKGLVDYCDVQLKELRQRLFEIQNKMKRKDLR